MKRICLCLMLSVIASSSCSREKKRIPVAAESPAEIERLKLETEKKIAEIHRKLDRDRYYSAVPSIESLLESPLPETQFRSMKTRLTHASIITLDEQRDVTLKERIHGKFPDDPADYLPKEAMPGNYVIGQLMPSSGWGGGRPDGRPDFCFRLEEDGTFKHGFEDELTSSLTELRKHLPSTTEHE